MSKDMAEKVQLDNIIDERFAGMAVGVGTQKIVGKVHYCQLEISQQFFHCSFSILEGQKMDIILGLDFLKRHQASIDLQKGALVLPASNVHARFLNESELPESAKMQMPPGDGEAGQQTSSSSSASKVDESKVQQL